MLLGMRYELVERIGVGATASVFRARDTVMDRYVALKSLHPDLMEEPEQIERFDAEADLHADLDHPGLPAFYGSHSPEDPVPWFALQLIDGQTLAAPDNHGLSTRDVLQIGITVCDALQHLHDRHIVHRDLKPENILLDQQGRAFLIDLGIARRTQMNWTTAGSVLGTPSFMSPEQAVDPRSVDGRSDLYSLGLTLFTVMTRRSSMELAYDRYREQALGAVPTAVKECIRQATEMEPADRFQSAGTMRSALSAALKALES